MHDESPLICQPEYSVYCATYFICTCKCRGVSNCTVTRNDLTQLPQRSNVHSIDDDQLFHASISCTHVLTHSWHLAADRIKRPQMLATYGPVTASHIFSADRFCRQWKLIFSAWRRIYPLQAMKKVADDKMIRLKIAGELTLAIIVAELCIMTVDTRSIGSNIQYAGKWQGVVKTKLDLKVIK